MRDIDPGFFHGLYVALVCDADRPMWREGTMITPEGRVIFP